MSYYTFLRIFEIFSEYFSTTGKKNFTEKFRNYRKSIGGHLRYDSYHEVNWLNFVSGYGKLSAGMVFYTDSNFTEVTNKRSKFSDQIQQF